MWSRIIIGFFLCVFAFNAYFVYTAINSSRGAVTESPYDESLNYNQRQEQLNKSAKLAWKIVAENKLDKLKLKILDSQNKTPEIELIKFEGLNLSSKSKKFSGECSMLDSEYCEIDIAEKGMYQFDFLIRQGGEEFLFFEKVFIG